MNTNTWIYALLLVFVAGLHAVSADNPDKLLTIDGRYAMMPQSASKSALLAQDLGSLVVDPLKFANLKVTGKIEAIQLTVSGDTLEVIAFDSSGARVLSAPVSVEHDVDGSTDTVTLRQDWKSGDEWGSSKGTTVTRLSRQNDGTLFVAVSTVSSGRTFIFPRGKSKADSWLKYAPVPPVEPSTPPKKKDESANGLFGRGS